MLAALITATPPQDRHRSKQEKYGPVGAAYLFPILLPQYFLSILLCECYDAHHQVIVPGTMYNI